MYEYRDYFDKNKRDEPYISSAEELDDYLRLLDMLLEGYLEQKGMSKEKKLFSRGLVITESEMESYFSMPPYYRDTDIWDPVIAMASEEAFDFIGNRVQCTGKQENGVFLPIEYLINKLSLDRTGILSLILVIAQSVDRKYERIYGFLQDDIREKTPTIGLLYALLRRMTPREESGLFLPEIKDREMFSQVFLRGISDFTLGSRLYVDPLIRKLILSQTPGIEKKTDNSGSPCIVERGQRYPSREPFYAYEEEDEIPLFFENAGQKMDKFLTSAQHPFCYFENRDWETAAHILSLYCKKNGVLYVLDSGAYMRLPEERKRECLSALYLRMMLTDGLLCVRYEREPADKQIQAVDREGILKELSLFGKHRTVILTGEEKEPGNLAAGGIPAFLIPEPDAVLRSRIWEFFLKNARLSDEVDIPDIADCYDLPYGMIKSVCRHVIESAKLTDNAVTGRKDITESIRQINQVNFEHLATYVKPVYTWEDLTIDPREKKVLKTACDRYRLKNRVGDSWGLKKKNAYGNGVSILLFGPPGTGKTMAAQVMARELSLPLYRVDVSQIFSKYIGETEKNLREVFDAAAKGNVILFFDEADALFAKRTEVSQSNDKYSNSETAYLLQKIEEYDGMSILATNYFNNFDSAFVRRITYTAHLDLPDEDARYALWTGILPPETEIREDIDFHFLAEQFDLSGSNIKAILFSAAYMAGAEEKPVGPEHIVRAMQYEFLKTSRVVDRSKFGMYGVYLV